MTWTRRIRALALVLASLAAVLRAAPAFGQGAPKDPGPIIDVHLHAYPADEAIPDVATVGDPELQAASIWVPGRFWSVIGTLSS